MGKSLIAEGHDTPSRDPLQAFEVGEWRVDPALQQLRRGAETRKLPPRQLQLLRVLALAAGQTLSREALIERVWSRRMVNDEVLSRSIADLRLALDDDARQPRYLITVPKLGYRLIATVRWREAASDQAVIAPGEAPASMAPAAIGNAPAVAPGRWRWPVVLALPLLALLLGLAWWRAQHQQAPDRVRQLLAAEPLTSAPGWELTPSFDHAGMLLAYSETDPGRAGARIRLRSRDGQIDRVYAEADGEDLCPRFSPDDRELVWTRFREERCELLRAPVLGGPPRPLGACAAAQLSCPDWQGEWLVYSAPPLDAQHAAGVVRLHLGDGRREVLSAPTHSEGPDLHPRFGPDGAVVFARGMEGDRSLWRWHDGQLSRIALPAGMLYGHAALPEGGWLLASDAAGFRALIALHPDRPGYELLGARGARFPAAAADGSLVYEVASYDANIYRHAAAAAAEQLTRSLRYDAYPRVSPDGRWLVYQSNRDGAESLYLLDLRDGGERRLSLDPQHRWAQPAWAADSRGLSLSRYRRDGVDLWWYALDTDRAEPLRHAPAGCHDAQSAADGRNLWCRVGSESAAELWRFARDGAEQQALLQQVAHYQLAAEDLVYQEAGSGRLHHCRADATGCQILPIEVATGQARNIALHQRALYYVPSGQEQVRRHSLIDGHETDTGWPAPGTLTRSLDVGPDGSAYIARVDRLDVDLAWVRGNH